MDIAYELLSLFLFRTHMPPSLSFARMRTRTDTHTHTHTNACTAHTRAHTHTRKPTYTRMRTHMRPHRQYFVATCGWVHVYVSACEGGCVDGMWAHAFEFFMLVSTHCITLQHTATHCNTLAKLLQYTCNILATRFNTLQHIVKYCPRLQHTATHCNTLQRTATRLQHTCNTLATHLQHASTHCKTL